MRMLESAWSNVTKATIANCWKHAKICPNKTSTADVTQAAWDVILTFARSESMSLPQAEQALEHILGTDYHPKDWQPALDAVMICEGDSFQAESAIQKLMPSEETVSPESASPSSGSSPIQHKQFPVDRHMRKAEEALSETLKDMSKCHCIRGPAPSLDNILNPLIEQQDPGTAILGFSDGDNTTEVLEHMENLDKEELEAVKEENEPEFEFDRKEAMAAAELLERIARNRPDLDSRLTLGTQLRSLRLALSKEVEDGKKQTEISQYFK
ncbi:unnamed protein product [Mycena citricolor]|uniref:Uncharacterized protein n=1 Tax=Mycena citricolor TaxID=2018698 RepID=A0AAD2HGX8_9AGAR|nr:unnamed protein product [Mycena citricolor]